MGTAPDQVAYRLVDYAGGLVTQGRLHFVKANQWEASLQPAQGYYEVERPASGQRFGVICLPGWKGKPDSFFAIDGGLSWLVSDTALREQLIDQARRSGISMVRERLNWSAVNPDRERLNLDGPSRYDSLRQFYRLRDMPILQLAHDAPGWLGHVRKYPHDLPAAAASWAELGRRWASAWGGLEAWNEPDIDFGGGLPADQYVAIAKAISFGMSSRRSHSRRGRSHGVPEPRVP